MPSIPIHPRPAPRSATPSFPLTSSHPNPLPSLLQTPSGLALVELQGTINMPPPDPTDQDLDDASASAHAIPPSTQVGRLVFPLLDPSPTGAIAGDAQASTAWMKRVYLYIGKHQRMTGEVRKLAKPIAVLRRRQPPERLGLGPASGDGDGGAGVGAEVERASEGQSGDELEIAEIVRYKILFASRPEPVGVRDGGES